MAAGITWTRKASIAAGGLTIGGTLNETLTKSRQISDSVIVPASTIDQLVTVAWTRTKMHGFAVHMVKDDSVNSGSASSAGTLKTNSTSSPGDTLTTAAGTLYGWMEGYDATASKPLNTADVTAIYLTNPNTVDVRFDFAVLLDN
jgi:hypothetical protein